MIQDHRGDPVSPLRVAMVAEQLWQPTPGGSGTYARELLDALDEREDVLVRGVRAAHTSGAPSAWRPRRSVRWQTVPLPRPVLYRSWSRLRWPRVGYADVVHAPTFAVPATSAALVVTVHDLAFRRHPEFFTTNGLAFFERAMEITRGEAAQVIVGSTSAAQDLIAVGFDAGRITVVPHGVSVPDVSPMRVAAVRETHGLSRPYVLWCGTLEPRKNVGTLLRAFAEVAATTDLDLAIAGPDGWGTAAEEYAELSTLLPQHRVHRLGNLGWHDLHAAYRGASAFAFPSRWEGFGLPVLEAMAHGVPTVISDTDALVEVAGGAAIVTGVDDVAGWAAAIVTAAGDRAAELRAAGLARAAEFTWAATAQATAAVYRAAFRG